MRTSEVFANIKSHDLLLIIAAKRNVDVEEHSKNLGKAIAADAFNTGIKKFVELLPALTLDEFGVETKNADGQKLHRSVVRKRIIQKIQDDTPTKFFEGLDAKVLGSVFDHLGEDKPSNSKKYVEEIIKIIDLYGLENALSTLSLAELQGLCKAHKLKVSSSTSANAHIDALVTGEDQRKEKTKAVKEEPSKKKPEIKKGVTRVDLQHHFYREELAQFCKDNRLPHNGTKSQLIKLTLDHLEGKTPATKKRKAPAGGKKEKPAKKARTTKSPSKSKSSKSEDKSEKSEKEDKSEKSEKEDKSEKSGKEKEKEKEKEGKEKGKKN